MANIHVSYVLTEEAKQQAEEDKKFWAIIEEIENKPLGEYTLDDWWFLSIAYG